MHFPIGPGTLPGGAEWTGPPCTQPFRTATTQAWALNVYELTTAWVEGTVDGTTCTGTQNGANWAEADCDATGFWASGNATTGFSSADYNNTALGSLPATDNVQQHMSSDGLTDLVKGWLAGTNSNEGLAFLPNITEQDIALYAKENSAAPSTTNDAYITINYLHPQTGACTINTDGQSVFSVNANAPKYNMFNGTTNAWGLTATNTAALANKQRFLALVSGTTRNESIASPCWTTARSPARSGTVRPGRDPQPAGYQRHRPARHGVGEHLLQHRRGLSSVSGDAVVVWDDNAQTAGNKLRFATYDGTTVTGWSAATSITAPAYAGDEPLYMQLVSRPGADDMVLVVNDRDLRRLCPGLGWIRLGQRRQPGHLGHGRRRPHQPVCGI